MSFTLVMFDTVLKSFSHVYLNSLRLQGKSSVKCPIQQAHGVGVKE